MANASPVPRIVPALLGFTAGFVDACTFLALYGLPCLALVLAILLGLIAWAARA